MLGLFSNPAISEVIFQILELDDVGCKPCSLLLKQAISFQEDGDWECCRKAAAKAREYAWEQLHR